MGAIDNYPCSVQALYELYSKATQPRIGALLATVSYMILYVIRQLNDADAESLVEIHKIKIALDRVCTLNVQVYAQFPRALSGLDVLGLRYQKKIVSLS